LKALVLAAHGSRLEASNEEVRRLARRLTETAIDAFQRIEVGFLELTRPSIPEAVTSCVSAGSTTLIVVPCFLSAGRHVSEDIPRIVDELAFRHPDVAIRISDHIGASASMARLILEAAAPLQRKLTNPQAAPVTLTWPAALRGT